MLRLTLFVLLAMASSAQALTGWVNHVRDGDTLEIEGVPIRLGGVACDESGTPLGEAATDFVEDLLLRQNVAAALDGERTHDRFVGRVFYSRGPHMGSGDLGETLIRGGLCGRCAAFDPEDLYVAAQQHAGTYLGAMPSYCTPKD